MAEQVVGERPNVEVGGELSDEDVSDNEQSGTNILDSSRKKSPPPGAVVADKVSDEQESCDVGEESGECPICLQPWIHPVQLPCTHIFCFLCVKGVANQSKKCALCRSEIPVDYLNNPALVRKEDLMKETAFDDGYQWFYEGNRGWWQYDERASAEIEERYKNNEKTFEILIAGFLYVLDLENKHQYRRNDPTRRRRIKRDSKNIPDKKGIAGLKYKPPGLAPHVRRDGDGGEIDNNNTPQATVTARQPRSQQPVSTNGQPQTVQPASSPDTRGLTAQALRADGSNATAHAVPSDNTVVSQPHSLSLARPVAGPGQATQIRVGRLRHDAVATSNDKSTAGRQVQGGPIPGQSVPASSRHRPKPHSQRQQQQPQSHTAPAPVMLPIYPQPPVNQQSAAYNTQTATSPSSDSDTGSSSPTASGLHSPRARDINSLLLRPRPNVLAASTLPQHLPQPSTDTGTLSPPSQPTANAVLPDQLLSHMAAMNLSSQSIPRQRPRGCGRDANDNIQGPSPDTDESDSDWH